MKTLKITLVMLLIAVSFSSCIVVEENNYYDNGVSLDELLQSTDLWYIDYNNTTGYGNTRFMSLAFTLSFENGKIYANNNLVGLGSVGGGYGDQIGFYSTNEDILRVDHDLDGFIEFEVTQVGSNLKFSDLDNNVTYTLIPYSVNNFDYDKVFYDNIEYFLQEYVAWEKTGTFEGVTNAFDDENFLAFIPENVNVFKSSQDQEGTFINDLLWDFTGEYQVFDVQGTDTLKVLTLNYDGSDTEEFELSVLNDGKVELYHISSGTYYEFNGRENIIYKNNTTNEVTKTPRKRFKVKRSIKTVKKHIARKEFSKQR
jgi:hypothetical protein